LPTSDSVETSSHTKFGAGGKRIRRKAKAPGLGESLDQERERIDRLEKLLSEKEKPVVSEPLPRAVVNDFNVAETEMWWVGRPDGSGGFSPLSQKAIDACQKEVTPYWVLLFVWGSFSAFSLAVMWFFGIHPVAMGISIALSWRFFPPKPESSGDEIRFSVVPVQRVEFVKTNGDRRARSFMNDKPMWEEDLWTVKFTASNLHSGEVVSESVEYIDMEVMSHLITARTVNSLAFAEPDSIKKNIIRAAASLTAVNCDRGSTLVGLHPHGLAADYAIHVAFHHLRESTMRLDFRLSQYVRE
jgi:hypothetical protein